MHAPIQVITKLWQDDHGTVISAELMCIAVVALIGLIAAFTSVRDAAISELSDVGGSIQDLTQCYAFDSLLGHSSRTTGSDFIDATDHCDDAEDTSGVIDNCIVLTEPEDEGGSSTSTSPVTILLDAEGDDVSTTTGGGYSEGWNLWSNGQLYADVEIPEDGLYKFSANLWGQQGGADLPNAALLVDGVAIQDFDVTATSHDMADEYCVEVFLTAGTHQFAVEYTNDFFSPPIDRNLLIDWIQVVGPN